MQITKDMVFSFSEGVKAREEDFGLLVVSKSTPALSLNQDSKFVWNLIDGEKCVSDILSALEKEYQEDGLENLLFQTLESLYNLGLIKLIKNKD